MRKIGLVTVGQAPRTDVTPTLQMMMSGSVEFIEAGALDNLTKQEILKLTPKDDRDVLVSRMSDGSEVTFGKSHIIPRLQRCIHDLNSQGAEEVALLCTGSFPKFESKAPIVRPDLLMYGFLKSIPNITRIGLMVPNERQQEPIKREFEDEGLEAVTSWLSPYKTGSVEQAVEPFKRQDVRLISLHCMGYRPELKTQVVGLTSKPAVLSQSLLAKAIDELLV